VNTTTLARTLAAATIALCLTTGATAQFLPPPSINVGAGGVSPRANQMKGDARAVKDASRSSSKSSNAAKATKSTKATSTVDQAPGYPTAASTAVHRCASEGKTEEIRAELMTNPGDLAKKDAEGFLPLHLAAAGGYLDTVDLLLVSGSDVNAQGTRGETPIYLAAAAGKADVVAALLAAGADPNLANFELRTPLQRAAMEGSLETVKVLLKGGADAAAKDKQGRTALDLAERYNKGPDGNRVVAALLAARK
jgi:hypothetical protein